MTTLAVWVAVQRKRASSVYIASDSRITWIGDDNVHPAPNWDYARKVFACRIQPDILGYEGDVLFTTQVLGQLVDVLDAMAPGDREEFAEAKLAMVADTLKKSFATYPEGAKREFSVVHCTRIRHGRSCTFKIRRTRWTSTTGWTECDLPIPATTDIVDVFGSGRMYAKDAIKRWWDGGGGYKSFSIYCGVCDAIATGTDRYTGGAPQMVGLYTKEAGRAYGIIYDGLRYVGGVVVGESTILDRITWYNSLFEDCDPITMARKEGARRRIRPRGL